MLSQEKMPPGGRTGAGGQGRKSPFTPEPATGVAHTVLWAEAASSVLAARPLHDVLKFLRWGSLVGFLTTSPFVRREDTAPFFQSSTSPTELPGQPCVL